MDEELNSTPAALPVHDLSYATAREDKSSGPITYGEAASLAVRIVGFYVLAQALPMIGYALDEFLRFSSVTGALGRAIPAAVMIGAGLFFVLKGPAIARWILPRTVIPAVEAAGPPSAQLQAIAFSVVGLVLAANSIPILLFMAADLLIGESRGPIKISPYDRFSGSMPTWLRYVGEAALGVWLFFGSKTLAAFWWRLRHPEFQPASSDEPELTQTAEPSMNAVPPEADKA